MHTANRRSRLSAALGAAVLGVVVLAPASAAQDASEQPPAEEPTGDAATDGGFQAAAAPSPVDDSLNAPNGAGALDVLANDSDPDGDDMTVTDTTQPANGTVECSALGACLYVADEGFTGNDSFTYTVEDTNGESGTATVNVTVPDVQIALPPVVENEQINTVVDTPGSVNVLANDSDPNGDPITVAANTNGTNGTVVCTPAGDCTYTPDAGFTGFDVFTYDVSDGELTTEGQVNVAVAPDQINFNPAVTGQGPDGGTTLVQGEDGTWTASAVPATEGIDTRFAATAGLQGVQIDLEGPHALDPGSVATAKGWAFDGVDTFAPSDEALLGTLVGDQFTSRFPEPLPPISQGTGGDGHVPIIVGSKIFAVFHHDSTGRVTCVDRLTGEQCPGYPIGTGMRSGNGNGPGAVVGDQFWVHLLPGYNQAGQSKAYSLLCWDATLDRTCGLVIVDRVNRGTTSPSATAPWVVNGDVWFVGDNGVAYCVDPTAHAPCADTPSIDSGIGEAVLEGNTAIMDLITHDGKLFASRNTGPPEVFCIDTITEAPCEGWDAAPYDLGGYNLITRYNDSGSITGTCVVDFGPKILRCFDDDDPSTTTDHSGWPAAAENYYTVTKEAETGTRTFLGTNFSVGVNCWDWTTLAPCAGPNFDDQGRVSVDSEGNSLPRSGSYGAEWDGSCVIALGDAGVVFTLDTNGASPCTSLSSGAATVIDLRDQRCDGGVGAAAWDQVVISDADLSEGGDFESLVVIVRDADTNELLLSQEMVGTNGSLDLSGLPADAYPALLIDATAQGSEGNPAWEGGAAPSVTLSWDPDPLAGCFQTTTVAGNCDVADGTELTVTGVIVDQAEPVASASLTMNQDPEVCVIAVVETMPETGSSGLVLLLLGGALAGSGVAVLRRYRPGTST